MFPFDTTKLTNIHCCEHRMQCHVVHRVSTIRAHDEARRAQQTQPLNQSRPKGHAACGRKLVTHPWPFHERPEQSLNHPVLLLYAAYDETAEPFADSSESFPVRSSSPEPRILSSFPTCILYPFYLTDHRMPAQDSIAVAKP
jgi:hypothetical protein